MNKLLKQVLLLLPLLLKQVPQLLNKQSLPPLLLVMQLLLMLKLLEELLNKHMKPQLLQQNQLLNKL